LFNYTGGNDTFAVHNPVNATEPPFLEDLVAAQKGTARFNETVANCTADNVLSTSCLYDTLTTNRSDIGQSTLLGSTSSETLSQSNGILIRPAVGCAIFNTSFSIWLTKKINSKTFFFIDRKHSTEYYSSRRRNHCWRMLSSSLERNYVVQRDSYRPRRRLRHFLFIRSQRSSRNHD